LIGTLPADAFASGHNTSITIASRHLLQRIMQAQGKNS